MSHNLILMILFFINIKIKKKCIKLKLKILIFGKILFEKIKVFDLITLFKNYIRR